MKLEMRRACIAIRKGVVLPKRHGRLIDADELRRTMKDEILKHNLNEYGCLDLVKYAPIIIEADKEEE